MGTTIKIHRGDDSGAFGGHLFSITNTEALYDIKTVEIGFGVVKLRYSQPQEGDMFPIVVDLDVVQTNVNGIGDYPISVTAYDSNDRRLLINQSCTLSVVSNSESIPTPYELTVLFDIADVMPTSSDEPEPYDPGESPRRGKQYYNTETDRLLVFNGDTYDVIAYSDDAPSAHTHGNISNTGAVGTTANLPLITGTNGVVQTGTFGNSANTFCEGNDSRLSDARTPTAHTHGNSDITGIDASKINSGTIDLDRLPQGALDRLVKVANQSERFALTTASVQNGDTVQQLDTGLMYRVVDDTKLNSEDGYAKYTADRASAVPWSGVTDKPSTFTPSSHTHAGSEITSAVDKSDKTLANEVASNAPRPVLLASKNNITDGGDFYGANKYSNGLYFNPSTGKLTATGGFVGDLTGNADSATALGSTTVGSANNPIYLNNGVPTACTLTTSVVTELPSTPDSNTIYIVVEEDEPVSLNMSRGLNLQENGVEPIEESEIEEVEPVIEDEPETVEPVEEPEEQGEER